jgi:hypothetical protein
MGKQRITKTHLICYVLSQSNQPLSKTVILQAVATIEGKLFIPTSNGSYFKAKPNPSHWMYRPEEGGQDAYKRDCGGSLVANDLIVGVAKDGNTILYGLTDKGREIVKQYKEIVHIYE